MTAALSRAYRSLPRRAREVMRRHRFQRRHASEARAQRYAAEHGWGLDEARRVVERLERGESRR